MRHFGKPTQTFSLVLLLFTLNSACSSGQWEQHVIEDKVAGGPSKEEGAEQPAPGTWSLKADVEKWKQLLPAKDVYAKLVDNRGNGDESLYGLRNLRLVLHGVYYRGGANNKYNKDEPRENSNPLPTDGLRHLCEKGFSQGIYYYSTNYQSAPPQIRCSIGNEVNELDYNQKTALSAKNHASILKEIFRRIKGELKGPIYGHCWNGWHASGLIAAISLQQFCHWSPAEAEAYWIKNTDGNSTGYDSVKKMVKSFQRIPELEISNEERALICPTKAP